MEKRTKTLLTILALFIAFGVSGCAPASPEEACFLTSLASPGVEDVAWDGGGNNCYIKATGAPCYPKYEVSHWVGPDYLTDWVDGGCGTPPTSALKNKTVINDPQDGEQSIGGAGDFGYDPNTCDGACSVALHALTGKATQALSSLPGKVIEKAYVQIKDKTGELDYGSFSLCFPVKGANNPVFYRYGGGNPWSYVGGFWKGEKFCMYGTASGNYVLVNQP